MVRLLHVDTYRVKLCSGQVEKLIPRLAAIVRDMQTTIIAQQNLVGIFRIDPNGVMVHVHTPRPVTTPCLPTVFARVERHTAHVKTLIIRRIDPNLPVIVGRRASHTLLIYLNPGPATVLTAIHFPSTLS